MSSTVRTPASMARSPHRRSADQNAVLHLLPQKRCGLPPRRRRNGLSHQSHKSEVPSIMTLASSGGWRLTSKIRFRVSGCRTRIAVRSPASLAGPGVRLGAVDDVPARAAAPGEELASRQNSAPLRVVWPCPHWEIFVVSDQEQRRLIRQPLRGLDPNKSDT
jgi:hypothetical protein